MKDPSAKFETRLEKLRPRSDSEKKSRILEKKNLKNQNLCELCIF